MKEDILEQLAENYLHHLGYFTCHNIKFLPSRDDRDYMKREDDVASDIDILAVHPKRKGAERVIAVSCKSWMKGFSPESIIKSIENDKKLSGKPAWKSFRELVVPKWSRSFIAKIEELTGQSKFSYWTLVVNLKGEPEIWQNYPLFKTQLNNNPIRLITLEEMINKIMLTINTTPSASELERVLQLINAAGLEVVPKRKKK